jgi:hypothetical protein
MTTSTTAADGAACIAATLRFFRALDARDHPACVAAFAQGGAWHRQGRRLDTPESIAASLDARPTDRSTAHLITNLLAEPQGPDRFVVTFLLTAFDGSVEAEGSTPTARFAGMLDGRDEYVRTPQGWRIVDKRSRPVFKGA